MPIKRNYYFPLEICAQIFLFGINFKYNKYTFIYQNLNYKKVQNCDVAASLACLYNLRARFREKWGWCTSNCFFFTIQPNSVNIFLDRTTYIQTYGHFIKKNLQTTYNWTVYSESFYICGWANIAHERKYGSIIIPRT